MHDAMQAAAYAMRCRMQHAPCIAGCHGAMLCCYYPCADTHRSVLQKGKVSHCIYPEAKETAFQAKYCRANHVSSIISVTFGHFKLCNKRCRPKHCSPFLVNVCNHCRKQISGLFLFRSWMRQRDGACPSSSTSPSLVQPPVAK